MFKNCPMIDFSYLSLGSIRYCDIKQLEKKFIEREKRNLSMSGYLLIIAF